MVNVEKLEKNMVKLTIEVPADTFTAAIKTAFNKNKNKFQIPGFRKGKAPQAMIEKMYGVGVFYEDAIDEVLPESYEAACKESGLEIVSRPSIEIVQVEKGKEMIYTATVAVKPEVTLGQYKGVEVAKANASVTEEDVEAEIKSLQQKNARTVAVSDRAVADGDKVVIDFEGFVDGKPFEGGSSQDYELVIGSHSFIDTFEVQLIGKNVGEECEVNVTFPEDYHAANLAGKPALFKVAVKSITVTELPEVNDDFIDMATDFETLEEYKADLQTKLADKKQKAAETENENNVVDLVVANAQMEIPDAMIESQVDDMISDYENRMQQQGISLAQYMEWTGMTVEQLRASAKPQAETTIRTRLVLEAVVAAENLQVSDEKVDAELAKMAENFSNEKNTITVDQIKTMYGERGLSQMKQEMAVQEAITFLVNNANFQ